MRADTRRMIGDGRLTWAVVAIIAAIAIGGILLGLTTPSRSTAVAATLDADLAIAAALVQILAIVVGADAFAGEFARGTIDATLTFIPRRGLLLAGRTCATGVVLAGTGLLGGVAAGLPPLILGIATGTGFPAAAIASWILGTVGLMAGAVVVGLLALAIGVLTRQRAAAILSLIGLLYLAPVLVGLLPISSGRAAFELLLPSNALSRLTGAALVRGTGEPLWVAVTDLALLSLLALAAAHASLRRGGRSRTTSRRRTHRPPMYAAIQTSADTHSTFTAQLRSEVIKITTQPAPRILATVSVAVALLFTGARAATDSIEGVGGTIREGLLVEFPYAITAGVGVIALMTSILAIALVASEFETGTATITFIAAHRRSRITATKLVIATTAGLILALITLLPAYALAAGIYTARGYPVTPDILAAGWQSATHAGLFLLLITLLSTGIAGLTRRTTTTVLLTGVALVIGPVAFNTILGFARATSSPLIPIGNLGRLLPWEGADYFAPPSSPQPAISIDPYGILHVSPSLAICITAAWAVAAVLAWYLTELRRPVDTA